MGTSLHETVISNDKREKRGPRSKVAPIEFNIRCSGKIHRVTVHWRGRITFHSHTRAELKALSVFNQLGDSQCGCLEVIKWLSDTHDPTKKPELKKLCDESRRIHNYRAYLVKQIEEGGRPTTREARRFRIKEMIENDHELRSKLVYPGFSDSGPYGHMGPNSKNKVHATISAGPAEYQKATICGRMFMDYSSSGKWKNGEMRMEVRLPIMWPTWWRFGIGVVQGLLVVDVKESDWATRDSLTVEIGRCVESGLGRPEVIKWLATIKKTEEAVNTYPTPGAPRTMWVVAEWVRSLEELPNEKNPADVYKGTYPL